MFYFKLSHPAQYLSAVPDGCALAIMHVRAHARQYGIDENRILVVGASAGGHLCASTAMLHEELKTEIFVCIRSWKNYMEGFLRGRTG